MKNVATGAVVFAFWVLCVTATSNAAAQTSSTQAETQHGYVPKLGSQVPSYVLSARIPSQQCLTNVSHHDPCASLNIDGARFTIAWDAPTKAITYVFTSDRRLIMDSELSVGGSCRLVEPPGKPYEIVHYMNWLVTPVWSDTDRKLSGDAVWYAALRKDPANPRYGTIVGFVQSRYLKVGQ